MVGALAGSPLQVSGPAAGLAVIVFDIVQKHGLATLGPIILLAGLFQIGAGALRLGQWFRAVSPAVIRGMLAGIGVLIFAGQLHVMIDDKPRANGLKSLLAIPEAIASVINPADGASTAQAAALGVITIAIMVLWGSYRPKRLRSVPPALVAVVTASALAAIFAMPVKLVIVPASLIESANWAHPEAIKAAFMNVGLIGQAFGVALIASAETLLCATAVDQLHSGPRTRYDKELIAQGVGNLLAGIFGALPITGVIVRSSANIDAGAKTRLSAIFHGIWLVIAIVALPWLLQRIPTSSLAAILVYTGYKLLNPDGIKKLWRFNHTEALIFFGTLGGIVATDLLKGVIIGFSLALVRLLWRLSRLPSSPQGMLGLDIQTQHHPEAKRIDVKLSGSATFLKLPALARALEGLPNGQAVHIDASDLRYIDHACMDLLNSWEGARRAFGDTLVVDRAALMTLYTGAPWTGEVTAPGGH
jgi:MFS superfamily sulfate permease-like transporter